PSKVRRHVGEDGALAREYEVSGRVAGRPPIGVRKVLDLDTQGAGLAEHGELVSPSQVQRRGRGHIHTIVNAGWRAAETRGREVQRGDRPPRHRVIDIDRVLQARLPECHGPHAFGAQIRADDADLADENAGVDVEIRDLLARNRQLRAPGTLYSQVAI